MKIATSHPRESERLTALKSLNLLDTVPEQEFDDLVLLASEICQTPIALISLVDESRQWFKSKVGINVNQTHKDVSFCAHAILQDHLFIVNDTTKSPDFKDNPLVTGDPFIRFYAGYPISDPNSNLPLGTLCVVDRKERQLTSRQVDSLKALSNQIQNLLQLRSKIKDLSILNEQLKLFKITCNSITEGVVVQDPKGFIVDFNPSALRLLEVTAEQLKGKNSLDNYWNSIKENNLPFPGEEHPSMLCLKTGLPQGPTIMGINVGQKRTKWLSIISNPLITDEHSNVTHAVTTFSDITEQKLAQEKLIYSEKMSSLGEMAGEMAHEMNTPLAVIKIASDQAMEALNEKTPDTKILKEKINLIDNTVKKISNIITGLKNYSRTSEIDRNIKVSLKEVASEAIVLGLETLKSNQIVIKCDFKQDYKVIGNPTQLMQVFVNLLNNSIDAIKNLNEKWITIEFHKKNNFVRVLFVDSGVGIENEIKDKIMLPFFTTKTHGKGTGLGLSISKSIIESINGIFYYDDKYANTCFVIDLPIAK